MSCPYFIRPFFYKTNLSATEEDSAYSFRLAIRASRRKARVFGDFEGNFLHIKATGAWIACQNQLKSSKVSIVLKYQKIALVSK